MGWQLPSEIMTMNHQADDIQQPGEAREPRPTDLSKPVGDAVPAPTEPGLDQPLPPKTPQDLPTDPAGERAGKTTDAPPSDVSRPLGDAVPTPAEPGLDQPLPPKKPA
jgi:hypothetical protein